LPKNVQRCEIFGHATCGRQENSLIQRLFCKIIGYVIGHARKTFSHPKVTTLIPKNQIFGQI
jgi:hypothetical protein